MRLIGEQLLPPGHGEVYVQGELANRRDVKALKPPGGGKGVHRHGVGPRLLEQRQHAPLIRHVTTQPARRERQTRGADAAPEPAADAVPAAGAGLCRGLRRDGAAQQVGDARE